MQRSRSLGSATWLILCFLAATFEGLDIQAVALAGQDIAKVALLGYDQLGFLFSAAHIGLIIGAIVGGRVADQIGRKPVLVAAIAVFGSFTIITALTADFYQLLAVRLLAGLGFGAALPNMVAIASEVATPERRGRATTSIFCGMPIGGAVAAVSIANLPAGTDWRSLFMVGGIAPLVLAVAIAFLARETRSVRNELAATGTNVAVALFGHGRTMTTLLIWINFFCTLLLASIVAAWLPSMVGQLGLSASSIVSIGNVRIGINAPFIFSIGGAIGTLALGVAVDKVSFRWLTVGVYSAMVAAMAGLATASRPTEALAYSGVAGFCIMGVQYALYSVAASYYAARNRGVGAGFATAAGRAGAVLGPTLFGMLLGSGVTVADTIRVTLVPAVVAGIAIFLLSLRPRVEQEPSSIEPDGGPKRQADYNGGAAKS